jgi:hypothetical protein
MTAADAVPLVQTLPPTIRSLFTPQTAIKLKAYIKSLPSCNKVMQGEDIAGGVHETSPGVGGTGSTHPLLPYFKQCVYIDKNLIVCMYTYIYVHVCMHLCRYVCIYFYVGYM